MIFEQIAKEGTTGRRDLISSGERTNSGLYNPFDALKSARSLKV